METWEIEFLKAMKGLTIMYGKECPRELLALYEKVLKPLTVEQLVMAVALWIEDPKHVWFPLPAQLKAMVIIPPDREAEAALIVDRMCSAQSSYGVDSVGTERAQNKIGEVGWAVIEAKGGWQRFWNDLQKEGVDGTIRSQLRKSVMGMMDQQKQEQINRIALPNGNPSRSLGSLGIKLPELPK